MAKSWSFVMRTALGGQHLTIATTLGRGGSTGHQGSVKHEYPDTDGLTKACRPKGRCTWRWSMTTKGSAQMILRGQERHNGAACWREALYCVSGLNLPQQSGRRVPCRDNTILDVPAFLETVADFEGKTRRLGQTYPTIRADISRVDAHRAHR